MVYCTKNYWLLCFKQTKSQEQLQGFHTFQRMHVCGIKIWKVPYSPHCLLVVIGGSGVEWGKGLLGESEEVEHCECLW